MRRHFAKVVSAGTLIPALIAALALVLAGCGGDDSSNGGSGASAEQVAGAEAGAGNGGGEGASEGGSAEAGSGAGGSDGGNGAGQGQQDSGTQPDEREPGITPQQREKATTASLTLTSPAFEPGKVLPSAHTCDGADTSPPLRWTGVPDGTAELVLLTLNFQPVNEALFFDWAVAGLDPGLTSLEAGQLPSGAVLGKNSFGKRGYSICPPPGPGETYLFMLYAIPEALDLKPGFDPLATREAVLDQAGDVGLLSATYARK